MILKMRFNLIFFLNRILTDRHCAAAILINSLHLTIDFLGNICYTIYSKRKQPRISKELSDMEKSILNTKLENLNNETNGNFVLLYAYDNVKLCEKINEYGGLDSISDFMNNKEMGTLLDTLFLLARKHNIKF